MTYLRACASSLLTSAHSHRYGGVLSCKKARLLHPHAPIDCEHMQIGRSKLYATKGSVPPVVGQFFQLYRCPHPCTEPFDAATLAKLPRFLLVSHLLHLLFRPLQPPSLKSPTNKPFSFDLAIHVRRGDKMSEQRAWEKLSFWNESKITAHASSLLPRPAASQAQLVTRRPRVLLASDDNRFAASLKQRLEEELGCTVTWLEATHLNNLADKTARAVGEGVGGGHWSSDPCDARCVPPLLELIQGFSHSARLMLNTRSNVGTFLLTWWPAANFDAMPTYLDMDGAPAPISPNRIWCDLPYGSRHGTCEGGAPPNSAAAKSLKKIREDAEYAFLREHKCRPPGRDANHTRWPSNLCCQANLALLSEKHRTA